MKNVNIWNIWEKMSSCFMEFNFHRFLNLDSEGHKCQPVPIATHI